jgi:chaperonin GroEL (HSP60 family)
MSSKACSSTAATSRPTFITNADKVRAEFDDPYILINEAGEDGSVVIGKILEKEQYAFGFDAQSGEYANLGSKGIIDPTKVVRTALQDGASIAGLLITTEAMVAELPTPPPPPLPGMTTTTITATWSYEPIATRAP